MDFTEEFQLVLHLNCPNGVLNYLEDSSNEEILELSNNLSLIIDYHFAFKQSNVNNKFSFIANSSLSGLGRTCFDLNCRSNKITELASFAALYSDVVYIRNSFEFARDYTSETVNFIFRDHFLFAIIQFRYFLPLIEKGIIKYSPSQLPFCDEHMKTQAIPLDTKIKKKYDVLNDILMEVLLKKAKVSFGKNGPNQPYIEITGPTNIIEHGRQFFHLYQPYSPIVHDLMKSSKKIALSNSTVKSHGIFELITSPILESLSKQEWHSVFFGSSYLFDDDLELRLTKSTTKNNLLLNEKSLFNSIGHYLPNVVAKDLSYLLHLRENEREAFVVYRDKLSKLLEIDTNPTNNQINDAFRDTVLPEVNLIDKKVSDWKKSLKESARQKLLFGTSGAAIGIYSGLIPQELLPFLSVLGGAGMLSGVLADFNKSLKGDLEARNNDMYFLWKANQ